MIQPLSICLPLIMAVTLLVSGIAKLRRPDGLTGWAELGVPKFLRRNWLLTLHPWGEIALAVLLGLLGGWAGVIVGSFTVALMAVYTLLITKVLRRPEDASCACFGERKRITRATLGRNIWLVILAVATACVIGMAPLLGGAVTEAVRGSAWGWVVGLVITAMTTWEVTRGEPVDAGKSAIPADATMVGTDTEDVSDYVRIRTPAVPITLADGSVKTLRELSAERPLLLLDVSQTCGACRTVIDSVEAYRELLPEVEVRLLLNRDPADTSLTETAGPQSLHDPKGYVSNSFDGMWATPAALLFGADGMLAGGPVVGADDIHVFVHQIRAELDS